MTENKSTLPELTDEQRRENLERAMQVRKERAQLMMRTKAGTVSISDAMDEDIAQGIRVESFLCGFPGIGKPRAQKMMRELHIAPNRRVRGLGKRQRENLIAAVDGIMAQN